MTTDRIARERAVSPALPGIYFVRLRGRNACGVGNASNEMVVFVE